MISEENKLKKLITFPQRINNISLLLIIVVYIAIFGVFSFLIIPKVSYTIIPNYEHAVINPDYGVYIKVTNTIEVDDNKKASQKGTITIYFDQEYYKDDYLVNYEVSRLDNDNSMHYLYSGKRSNYSTLPNSHTLVSGVSVSGGGYKTLFTNIKYHLVDNEEDIKTYQFKEDLLTIDRKELKKDSILEKGVEGKFQFTYKIIENGYGRMGVTLNFVPTSDENQYHIDAQSFLVTSSGEIYPLIGFYHAYSELKDVISGYTSYNKDVDGLMFVLKVNYYDANGEKSTYLYKEVIDK